jgi:hypothetical protein
MKYRLLTYIIFLLQFGILASSQAAECPVEIDVALSTANEICIGTGRNQVCYGNNDVNLMLYGDVEIEFDAPGDIAEINNIRTLSLSALDVENGQWGIAVMHLLANLDPSQSEDVTVLLFGDVEIEDASDHSEIQAVAANNYSNLRRLPNSSSPVMDSVATGDVIHVTGRLEDNSWVRVVNPKTNIIGWMFASLLDDIDFDSLGIVATSEPYFAPMQAFYFQSGTDAVDCASVPRDGIIVQTPEGLRRVTLWVNEVTIEFLPGIGSTASLQSEEDGTMSINVLEGSAYVSTETDGYLVVAGSSVNVKQSDGDNLASVSKPTATSLEVINDTPLDILDHGIELPEPATEELIAEVNEFADDTTTTNEVNTTDSSQATDSTSGGSGDSACNGNSCDAPGQNSDGCNGNSCNAPGKNKDKKNKKDK